MKVGDKIVMVQTDPAQRFKRGDFGELLDLTPVEGFNVCEVKINDQALFIHESRFELAKDLTDSKSASERMADCSLYIDKAF